VAGSKKWKDIVRQAKGTGMYYCVIHIPVYAGTVERM